MNTEMITRVILTVLMRARPRDPTVIRRMPSSWPPPDPAGRSKKNVRNYV